MAMALMLTAGTALPAEIPFQFESKVILVKGLINDTGSVLLVVDTGATETVITPPTARRLGITGLTAANGQKTAVAQSIAVGSVQQRDVPVFIYDPPQALTLRLDHGIDYHGILGHSFLSRYVLTINYADRVLSFGESAPQNRGPAISCEVANQRVSVPGHVNRKGPYRLLVDTGAAETVLLPDVARALGLRSSPMNQHPGVQFATVDEISVGNAKASKVPVVIFKPAEERTTHTAYEGILGTTFLSRFKVTIDYAGKKLFLAP